MVTCSINPTVFIRRTCPPLARKPPPSASSPTAHRWLSLWLLSIYNLLVFTNFQNFLKISRLLGCNSHWVFGHNPNNSRLIRGTSEEEESQVRTSIFNSFLPQVNQAVQHWGVATLTRDCFTFSRQKIVSALHLFAIKSGWPNFPLFFLKFHFQEISSKAEKHG